METWLLFGILAYVFYGISSSIDKYFMKHVYRPIATYMFKMFFNSLTILLVGIFFFNIELTLRLCLWSILFGSLY